MLSFQTKPVLNRAATVENPNSSFVSSQIAVYGKLGCDKGVDEDA